MSAISHRAPKTIYWVDLVTVGKLKYRQKGGGKYTRREDAETQIRHLAAQGIDAVLFEGAITWSATNV
ncbi:hypothetical protein [Paenarthrobacter sp. NPDC018779]|uniref:hypothetical protein n=1 Tax=Paenarthrobacter sp. NPDC018779 TaxID=3364375 RepID=UPI0037C63A7D